MDLKENSSSFSPVIETVFSGNLALMDSIYLLKQYFDGYIFSTRFAPIFTKKLVPFL